MDTAEISEVAIGLDEIRQAAERMAPWAHRTPVMTSKALDRPLRRLGVPQVRELPASRCVQVSRRDERRPSA